MTAEPERTAQYGGKGHCRAVDCAADMGIPDCAAELQGVIIRNKDDLRGPLFAAGLRAGETGHCCSHGKSS
ncbi:MAG: hypothetical protein ACLRWP_12965 [Bilophila wadsworthia]